MLGHPTPLPRNGRALRPGAYYAEGRAFGQLPAWVTASPTTVQHRCVQTPSSVPTFHLQFCEAAEPQPSPLYMEAMVEVVEGPSTDHHARHGFIRRLFGRKKKNSSTAQRHVSATDHNFVRPDVGPSSTSEPHHVQDQEFAPASPSICGLLGELCPHVVAKGNPHDDSIIMMGSSICLLPPYKARMPNDDASSDLPSEDLLLDSSPSTSGRTLQGFTMEHDSLIALVMEVFPGTTIDRIQEILLQGYHDLKTVVLILSSEERIQQWSVAPYRSADNSSFHSSSSARSLNMITTPKQELGNTSEMIMIWYTGDLSELNDDKPLAKRQNQRSLWQTR
jgi:hypothetical protein